MSMTAWTIVIVFSVGGVIWIFWDEYRAKKRPPAPRIVIVPTSPPPAEQQVIVRHIVVVRREPPHLIGQGTDALLGSRFERQFISMKGDANGVR